MEMMRFPTGPGVLSAQDEDHSVTGINGYVDIHGIFYTLVFFYFVEKKGENKIILYPTSHTYTSEIDMMTKTRILVSSVNNNRGIF